MAPAMTEGMGRERKVPGSQSRQGLSGSSRWSSSPSGTVQGLDFINMP